MFDWLRKRAAGSPAPKPAAEPALTPPPRPAHVEHRSAGRWAQAEAAARAALQADAADAAAAFTLVRVALARQRWPEARKALERARAMAPDSGEADLCAGLLALAGGKRQQATAAFETATRKDPGLADAHHQLAIVRRQDGDAAAAEQACRAAVRADPHHGAAHNDLGCLLRDRGDAAGAEMHLRTAVESSPELPEAWFNLGALQMSRGQPQAAAAALERSIALQPRQADALYWLGNAHMACADPEAAGHAYAGALQVDPGFLRARWGAAMAQALPVPDDAAGEAASLAAFDAALERLQQWVRTRAPAQAHEAVASTQPYYLAYYDSDLTPRLQRYGALCSQLMGAWARRAGIAPRPDDRPRVGIVSAHLHNHSVWNALLRGWVEGLARAGIELHLFQVGAAAADDQTALARRLATVHGPFDNWQAAGQAVVAVGPRVLIYAEVGLDSISAKLAALRLAPVQVATWGHPVTTGLPTIDHYLSAAALEPEGADAHYTEQLHLLPALGCTPRRWGTPPARVDLAAFGIDPRTPVLLCPGMPHKYRPAHDALWVEVARRSAPCRLVFFRGGTPELSRRLENRLRRAFGAAGIHFDDHVCFVPWQSQAAFFGWLGLAAAMLDSPGFSGFNTVMQAVECGTPIVAWDGTALRGRFAAGVLRELRLDEWIANDAAGYAGLAARLCRDDALRRSCRAQIEQRRAALFDDMRPTEALVALLRRWLSAA